MAIIEVDDVVRKFGELVAVDGVSFTVTSGEVFGFLGPNGAGKTTTINMLCTLLRPTSGRASIAGYDVVKEAHAVRKSIGLVFQDPSLDERLTARENLTFHAMVYGMPAQTRHERIEKVLQMVELWPRRDDLVRTFSGGMKRRLEIGRGLLHYPKVLFLDEPTIGLDPQTRNHIWEYVHQLRHRENITIFLTTHYMDEAENCDRIGVIDHGKIIALDTPENLKRTLGGDVITLATADARQAVRDIAENFGITATSSDGEVVLEVADGATFVPKLVSAITTDVLSISVRRPTLDDVFLHFTGRGLREGNAGAADHMRAIMRGRRK